MCVTEFWLYNKKRLSTLMSGPQSKKCVLKANSNTILSVEKIKFRFYCQTLEIVLEKVPRSPFLMTEIEIVTKR